MKTLDYIKKKSSIIVLILTLIVIISSFILSFSQNSAEKTTESTKNTSSIEKVNQEQQIKTKNLEGNVTIVGNEAQLDGAQKNLILNYYKKLFDSIASLKSVDVSEFFNLQDVDGTIAANSDQAFLDTLIYERTNQPVDLTIKEYQINLNFTQKEVISPTELIVNVYETQDIVFSDLDPVHSMTDNLDNTFTLKSVGENWYIKDHTREEVIHNMIRESIDNRGYSLEESINVINNTKNQLINSYNEQLAFQDKQRNEVNSTSTETISSSYDRKGAVVYANTWYNQRNPAYEAFDEVGGNCNNFISQCIIAGGLPTDQTGEDWWIPDYYTYGPSSSWILVDGFYEYAKNNTEGGFTASVTDNIYSGNIGDIIQLGVGDNWKHSVIITDIIKDDDGNIIDYLINSNSIDKKSFPLSAYGYPQIRLIKIKE